MEIRHLGASGLRLSLVGLGCNNFGGRIDERASKKVIDKAFLRFRAGEVLAPAFLGAIVAEGEAKIGDETLGSGTLSRLTLRRAPIRSRSPKGEC